MPHDSRHGFDALQMPSAVSPHPTQVPRVVAYVRCAASDPARLAGQEARIRRFAAHQGWELARVYADDGHSGLSSQRPHLERLQRDVEAGLVDLLVVDDHDRLYRHLPSLQDLLRFLQRHGVTTLSLNGGAGI